MSNDNEIIAAGRDFLRSHWDRMEKAVSDQSKGVPAPQQQKPCPAGGRVVDLVPRERMSVGRMPLIDAVTGRRSRRKYAEQPLSMEDISFLLWVTQGVREHGEIRSFRTVPSGGSRHGFETYLYTQRVDGLEEGLYRYQPLDHRLCLLRSDAGMREALKAALNGQGWNSAAVFVWTAVPYRTEWRYPVVAGKIIALDAGHVCQNLYLACESIGCGTCAIGAYDQEKLDAFLGVDGEEELAVYAAPVGRAVPE
jgi:SagB-type dehydrogenase family enzyme